MPKIDRVDLVVPFHMVDKLLWKAAKSASKSKRVSMNIIFMDDRREVSQNDGFVLTKIADMLEKKGIEHSFNKTSLHGYANALNESKLLVKSEFVAILNSDDLVSKNRLWRQAREIHKGFDLSICRLRKFNKIFFLPHMLGSLKTFFEPEMLLLGAYGADASLFTTKQIWQTDLEFTPDIEMSDWDMALRCYQRFKVSFISKPLYFYRMHKRQTSRRATSGASISSEFYASWCALAEKLKFPLLDAQQVSVVATPWSAACELSEGQKNDVLIWLKNFQERLEQKNLRSDVIDRRFILLKLRGYSSRVSFNVVIKMLLDLMWLCVLIQPPRIHWRPPKLLGTRGNGTSPIRE